MPLVFEPKLSALFLWGETAGASSLGLPTGLPATTTLVTPEGRLPIQGMQLPLLETVLRLSAVSTESLSRLSSSLASWALASKVALELVARERVVPTLSRRGDRVEARWAAALSAPEDANRVSQLAQRMPPSAHAVSVSGDEVFAVWSAEALLRAFLDDVIDALLRTSSGEPKRTASKKWGDRWSTALTSTQATFEAQGLTERSLIDDVQRWNEPAVGRSDRLRASFRLELPEKDRADFTLRFFLEAPDDASLRIEATEVWEQPAQALATLGRSFRDPQEALLEALGRAARLFTPLERSLAERQPSQLALSPEEAWAFLGEGGASLSAAGFHVVVPAELTLKGQRRLRLRMRVGGKKGVAGKVEGTVGLDLESLVEVDWQAMIGDEVLSAKELERLAAMKTPLVRHRGEWVAIDPAELSGIRARLQSGTSRQSLFDGVRAVLAGTPFDDEVSAEVIASGSLAALLDQIRGAGALETRAPTTLQATLRPYQSRGLHWLNTMGALGLGACLADDMGLGKTVQVLAFLLESAAKEKLPVLLVAPTSVVGNWEREIERFAPSLQVHRHYGADRSSEFPSGGSSIVLTTYGVLRRDIELLSKTKWSSAVLDEAQNIKNANSATAKAARTIDARHRIALTGTPVENRLAELWSILDYANPGFLGPLETFRRTFAVPIERFGNDEVAQKLRTMTSPFVLRRLKSDPAVISDLPAKNEMKMVCTLTREQATLYKAAVDEAMRPIEGSSGIKRSGLVLALMTSLKQICNHPAQFLLEQGPLEGRSGKLARLTEMLEEALASNDRALIFTQYREMGDRLVAHLSATLNTEVMWLHGATSKKARDEMVRRFQDDPNGPRVFVLSLKAGGTGLNLTAANHVFHFDRWWNPAVEDQATDRAYRIGQKRAVQVHKLVCAGTVEEKVDAMLEQKRLLASKAIGTGERWITELGNDELRSLFALSADAPTSEEDAPRSRKKAS